MASQKSQGGQQGQQTQQGGEHAVLQQRCHAVGVDWSWLSTLAPIVADAIIKILERLKNNPVAARAGARSEPDLEGAIKAAHVAAVENLCASCRACSAAGIEHC
jgi:hypothetical protein